MIVVVRERLDRGSAGTDRGRAFFQDACEVRAELEADFLGRLSPSRAVAFVAALRELVGATQG